MCFCLFPVDKIREAKTICCFSDFVVLWLIIGCPTHYYMWGRLKSNSIVECWQYIVDHFCVYLASHFPQAVPAVHINSAKFYLELIFFDKPFILRCNGLHLVVQSFVWLTCILLFSQRIFLQLSFISFIV